MLFDSGATLYRDQMWMEKAVVGCWNLPGLNLLWGDGTDAVLRYVLPSNCVIFGVPPIYTYTHEAMTEKPANDAGGHGDASAFN